MPKAEVSRLQARPKGFPIALWKPSGSFPCCYVSKAIHAAEADASAAFAVYLGTEKPRIPCRIRGFHCEVPSRFELENKGFADLRLTTWLWHRVWSGRRDSDSRHPPWQGGTLPLSYYRTHGALGRNRTTDTQIFSLLLYRLSYQGKYDGDPEGARTLDLQRDRLAL